MPFATKSSKPPPWGDPRAIGDQAFENIRWRARRRVGAPAYGPAENTAWLLRQRPLNPRSVRADPELQLAAERSITQAFADRQRLEREAWENAIAQAEKRWTGVKQAPRQATTPPLAGRPAPSTPEQAANVRRYAEEVARRQAQVGMFARGRALSRKLRMAEAVPIPGFNQQQAGFNPMQFAMAGWPPEQAAQLALAHAQQREASRQFNLQHGLAQQELTGKTQRTAAELALARLQAQTQQLLAEADLKTKLWPISPEGLEHARRGRAMEYATAREIPLGAALEEMGQLMPGAGAPPNPAPAGISAATGLPQGLRPSPYTIVSKLPPEATLEQALDALSLQYPEMATQPAFLPTIRSAVAERWGDQALMEELRRRDPRLTGFWGHLFGAPWGYPEHWRRANWFQSLQVPLSPVASVRSIGALFEPRDITRQRERETAILRALLRMPQ